MSDDDKIIELEARIIRGLNERIEALEERLPEPEPEPEPLPAELRDKPYRDMSPDEKVEFLEHKYGAGAA